LHKLLLLQEAGFSSIGTHLSYSFNPLSAKKSLQSESDFIKARLLVSSELIQILFWILLFVVAFSVAQLLLACRQTPVSMFWVKPFSSKELQG